MTFKHSTGSMLARLAGWIATGPLISHKQASRAICPRPVCTTDLFFFPSCGGLCCVQSAAGAVVQFCAAAGSLPFQPLELIEKAPAKLFPTVSLWLDLGLSLMIGS